MRRSNGSSMLPRAVLLVPEPESTPTALGIIRSLGRVSIPVVAAASNLTTPSFFSRYVKHRLVCPALEFEPINWKDALIEFGKSVDEKPVRWVSLFDGKPRVIVSSFINLDKRQFPYEHWRNSET